MEERITPPSSCYPSLPYCWHNPDADVNPSESRHFGLLYRDIRDAAGASPSDLSLRSPLVRLVHDLTRSRNLSTKPVARAAIAHSVTALHDVLQKHSTPLTPAQLAEMWATEIANLKACIAKEEQRYNAYLKQEGLA